MTFKHMYHPASPFKDHFKVIFCQWFIRMKTCYLCLQRDSELWHGSNDTVDTAWKQIKWWHNTNTVEAQKVSLLAQFAAAMTASQCWPSGWDTKSYNWRKEGRKREGEGERGGDGLRGADTNRGNRAQGPGVWSLEIRPAKYRAQYIRL